MRTDVYEKITNQIVSELEKGVRPWHQPWKAEHAAGRITRPLRGNGRATLASSRTQRLIFTPHQKCSANFLAKTLICL
jgi:hypothetical protein